MNAARSDFDRALRTWFDDGPTVMPDRVVDGIADRIARQPQRRTWRLRGRPFMNTYVKLAAAAAAALVMAVVGWQLLPGSGGFGGQPTPLPSTSPSTSPTTSLSPTLGSGPLPNGTLTAGRYTITPPITSLSGLTIAADIPAGWHGYPEVPALTGPSDGGGRGALIGFMPGEGLFSDPCRWNVDGTGSIDQPGDVEVGPTVNDFVEALQANTSYTSSAPSRISIGRFQGTVIDLQLPGDDVLLTCDGEPSQQSDHKFIVVQQGFWSQGPNSRWRLFILDVDGTRLITMLSTFGSIPQAELDAAEAIVESFEITP